MNKLTFKQLANITIMFITLLALMYIDIFHILDAPTQLIQPNGTHRLVFKLSLLSLFNSVYFSIICLYVAIIAHR